MVIYAVTAGVSLGDLFLAGFVPGTLMGVTMMVLIYYLAVTGRIKAPVQPRASARVVGRSFLRALPALLAPVVLVVGILVGAATPTELGALAVIYATLLGFLYRDLTLRRFARSLAESLVTTGTLAFVISAAIPFGWCIAVKNFPALVAEVVTGLTDNRWLVLLLLNIVLLIAGCFLETTAILLIATPTLYPLVTSYGIDPIHFGLVMLINLLIGTLTPPFGMILFIMMDITKLSLWQVTRAVMPFYIPLLVTLLLVTYFPQIVLFVPHWVNR
jgi:tripartite ATP-independent transporter DctM subunit